MLINEITQQSGSNMKRRSTIYIALLDASKACAECSEAMI
jgi:hypothetical protein